MFINNRYGSKVGIPAIFLASFVGYSRVYAEKHYWEDVLAGALISVISSIFYTSSNNTNNVKRKNFFSLIVFIEKIYNFILLLFSHF